jgi:hypothetical protein
MIASPFESSSQTPFALCAPSEATTLEVCREELVVAEEQERR